MNKWIFQYANALWKDPSCFSLKGSFSILPFQTMRNCSSRLSTTRCLDCQTTGQIFSKIIINNCFSCIQSLRKLQTSLNKCYDEMYYFDGKNSHLESRGSRVDGKLTPCGKDDTIWALLTIPSVGSFSACWQRWTFIRYYYHCVTCCMTAHSFSPSEYALKATSNPSGGLYMYVVVVVHFLTPDFFNFSLLCCSRLGTGSSCRTGNPLWHAEWMTREFHLADSSQCIFFFPFTLFLSFHLEHKFSQNVSPSSVIRLRAYVSFVLRYRALTCILCL